MKNAVIIVLNLLLILLSAPLFSNVSHPSKMGTQDEARRGLLQQVYRAEVGVREKTNQNDGKQVEMYLRYVGLPKGNPWCAAFVCWAMGEAGVSNPGSGWCPDLFPSSRIVYRAGKLVKDRQLEPGAVFGIWFPDKGRVAHVGFVDVPDDKYFISVEGNTNMQGSREGDGVYRKRRLLSSVYAIADWITTKRADRSDPEV